MKIALNKILRPISGDWGSDDKDGTGVNVIRTANFTSTGKIDFSKLVKRSFLKKDFDENGRERYVTDLKKIEEKKLLDNDIIIEKSGGGPGTPVGRVVYFENPDGEIYIANNFTQVLRVDSNKIDPKYLFYYLKYLYQKGVVCKYQNQTIGLSNLKLERYLKEEVYIPDLDKQKLFVTQLELIQKNIEFRRTSIDVMNELIFSVYYSIFESPIAEKSKWSTKKLSEIGVWQTGGTPDTNNAQNFEGDIPWFTSGELGDVFLQKSIRHISIEALKNSNAKLIDPNSILIGLYDTAAFKMSISTKECACNQAIIFGKLKEEANTLFVYYTLLLCKDFYLTKRKGARQKNLNASFIKNIKIIYPTTKNEKDKVALFFDLHALINEIREKQKKSLIILQELFQSQLHYAFKPDAEVDEEPIFNDLIKKFSVNDLIGNKQRLQYLINLFDQQNFNEFKDFSEIRKILFELMDKGEIVQVFEDNRVKLQVK